MQRRRIEVRTVWPHERMHLAVERNRIELGEITQGTVELAFQHWSEVKGPDEPIPELDAKAVRPHDLEGLDLVDRVFHAPYLLPEWFNLVRRPARLQAFPGGEQLGLMNLGPCFHEPPLPLRKSPSDHFDRINGEDANIVLIIRMSRWANGRPVAANSSRRL